MELTLNFCVKWLPLKPRYSFAIHYIHVYNCIIMCIHLICNNQTCFRYSIVIRGDSVSLFTDPPSSPLNPMLGFQNGTNTSVVTLQWTPPTSTGGVDVSYVLTVSPPPVSGSNITTQTSTDITVYYYIQYIVTIRAENCAGSSNGTVVMFELGNVTVLT